MFVTEEGGRVLESFDSAGAGQSEGGLFEAKTAEPLLLVVASEGGATEYALRAAGDFLRE